jgi:hypothetical protein
MLYQNIEPPKLDFILLSAANDNSNQIDFYDTNNQVINIPIVVNSNGESSSQYPLYQH